MRRTAIAALTALGVLFQGAAYSAPGKSRPAATRPAAKKRSAQEVAQFTYDLRAVGISGRPGGKISADGKAVRLKPGKGEVTVTFDIIGMVPNGNGNHADDGVQSGYLAFTTSEMEDKSPLPGDMSDPNGRAESRTGLPLANATLDKGLDVFPASVGAAVDADGDGDLDIGWTVKNGKPLEAYYSYGAAVGTYVKGTGRGTGATEIHIGTFKVRFRDPKADQGTNVRVWPRERYGPTTKHYWLQDGADMTDATGGKPLAGKDVAVTVSAGSGASQP